MKASDIASDTFALDERVRRDDSSYPMTREQFYDQSSRAHHLDGETRLLFAVLEDAIRCYSLAARRSRRSHQRALDEVKEWVNTRGDHDIFSFDSICAVFRIEPELLRRQLNSMPNVNLMPRRFTTVGRRISIAVPESRFRSRPVADNRR
jgi:hypothetical protein